MIPVGLLNTIIGEQNKNMRAVIYARYSCDRQTEQSIEGQLHECKAFAESEGIAIVGEYIDRALSGTTDKRPEFQRMVSDSRSHAFDAVIVYKLDRFARNRYDSAVYKSKLKANGVKVLSAKERITDSPEGIILEGLLESMNEYYSAELAQKVKRGMRENILKGMTTGGVVALGYRVGADKRMEVDPGGAALVRRIFEMYDKGHTYAEICDQINAEGYVTQRRKRYRGNTISRILANERYTGVRHYDGVELEYPKIIEPELFDRVQKRLDVSKTKHKRRKKAEQHEYMLTGKAICGECGKNLHGRCGSGRSGRYYYYCCPDKHLGWIPAEELERAVFDAISKYITPEMCDEIAKRTYAMYLQSTGNHDELTAARKQLQDVSKKLDNAVNAILSGVASDTLKAAMQQLEAQKASLEATIKRLQTESPKLELAHFEYFARRILTMQEEGAEKIVELLINQVIVYKDRITVLVNLTNNSNKPPLEQVTKILADGSHSVPLPPPVQLNYRFIFVRIFDKSGAVFLCLILQKILVLCRKA